MNRKAQAAMEFLMTYGWAILVVLAAIAALAYFGVLSPDRFLPEKCVLVPGLACLDFKVTSTDVTIILANAMGRDIDVASVSAGNCSETFNQELKNGDRVEFVLSGCSNGDSGTKFKGEIIINYSNQDTGMAKISKGSMSAKVQ